MALTSCCLCIGLKAGSLTFTVISALLCSIVFIWAVLLGLWSSLNAGLGASVFILCTYAIIKKKADLMLPALVCLMIVVVYLVVSEISMIVAYVNQKIALGGYNPDSDPDQQDSWKFMDFITTVFCILENLLQALLSYFWCVLFALYKEFKRERPDNDNNENVV